ncbi:MAG TPA: cardiolipin synthase B [Oscillatoriales cyanobacterium M59_W2019_021]|nr:cardiolipin synthase B [Oscillatoriales cyanobacterium M4454_W2019_049]HIK51885.1 cardiolipin synthase B [Oscillatoriales cyanobacterium M59_W2019_021]
MNFFISTSILFFALLLLFLFGLYLAGAFRARIQYRFQNIPNVEDDAFFVVLASLSNSLVDRGNITGFWAGASDIYNARWDAIRSARETLHFETYEMTPGRRAGEFAELLANRVKAGVDVKLTIDNYGAKEVPKSYWKWLKNAGVEVRFYQTFPWRSPLDNLARTHRKLLLIDGRTALIGGAGISDKWDGNPVPWLDFEVRFTGPAIAILEGMFWQNWSYAGGIVDVREPIFRSHHKSGDFTFLVTPGKPLYRHSPIEALVKTFIQAARKRVWIASPYLLPNSDLRHALCAAQKRGVEVRLLTMSRQQSDKTYVSYTGRELYGELLAGGVEIYEYQPSMMHAKVLLIDDRWVSFGSGNIDPRSLFLNDELNISTEQPEFAVQVRDFLQGAFQNSHRITMIDWRRRSFRDRAIGKIGLIFQRQL